MSFYTSGQGPDAFSGEFEIFRKVILSNSWTVIAALTIFTVMWRWNNRSWPLVSIPPVLIIFAFFQRYFVQGIASSGVK